MQVGVGLPSGIPGREGTEILEWARLAEAGPFASLDTVDRLDYDSYEPLVALSAAAAVTERIALATTILIGPLRNTVMLAKQLASLARLSAGRLVVGLGIGGRHDDYELAGVDHARRGRQLDAQITELRGLLESGRVGLRTEELPPPLILAGGQSTPAFARVARGADGYIHGGGPPRAFARAAEQVRAAWIDTERPGAPALWGQAYFALDGAAERGREYMRDYYAFTGPFAERITAGLLTSHQAVTELLHGYAEAGCDHLCLMPAVPDLEQLELVGAAVEEASIELSR